MSKYSLMITSGSVSGKVNIDGPQGNYNVVHLSFQEIFLLRVLVLKGEWIIKSIKNPMTLDLFNKVKNKFRMFCSGLSEAILVAKGAKSYVWKELNIKNNGCYVTTILNI